MKLKTLKDLCNDNNYPKDGSCLQLRDDLKQEAIKWIKFLREHSKLFPITSKENFDKEVWIRMFFNIKEDDLK